MRYISSVFIDVDKYFGGGIRGRPDVYAVAEKERRVFAVGQTLDHEKYTKKFEWAIITSIGKLNYLFGFRFAYNTQQERN